MAEPIFFYLDFETSGLDPAKHGIIQAAWIIERDREILNENCFDVALFPEDNFDLKALEINKFTLERIAAGIAGTKLLDLIKTSILDTLFQSSTIEKTLIPVGHNLSFDLSFLSALNKKCNANIWYFLNAKKQLCTCSMARWLAAADLIDVPDCKLETLCKYYRIPLDAHDAMNDIRATRLLTHIFLDILQE
jgi:DNA polymerase-3 subunit epsilon